MFNRAPPWVLKGAVLDFDFANGRYYGGSVSLGTGNSAGERAKSYLTTGSNAVGGVNYAPDSTGLLIKSIPSAAIRITNGIGAWSETDTTNTCLWCRDLTQSGSWTVNTVTALKDQIGADGVSNAASSLLATGANSTVLQSITSTSGTRVFSCYVKRLVGTGEIDITMDNGSTWTQIDGSINSSSYTRVQIPIASSANPVVGFRIVTNTDKIAVDFCQMEKLTGSAPTVATNPMLTTSASVTRCNGGGTEELFFNTPASNFNAGIAWVNNLVCAQPVGFVIVGSGNAPASVACLISGTDLGGYFITGAVNGTTMVGASGGVAGLGNINKMAFSLGGGIRAACVNGGTIATAAVAFSNTQATHGGLGNNGGGAISINGYISRATYFQRELTTGELINYTT